MTQLEDSPLAATLLENGPDLDHRYGIPSRLLELLTTLVGPKVAASPHGGQRFVLIGSDPAKVYRYVGCVQSGLRSVCASEWIPSYQPDAQAREAGRAALACASG